MNTTTKLEAQQAVEPTRPDPQSFIYPDSQPLIGPEGADSLRPGSSRNSLASRPPSHERMPSVNPLMPNSNDAQFGLVSSSGQLVCQFRPAADPPTAGHDGPVPQPEASEEKMVVSPASEATRAAATPTGPAGSPPQPAQPPPATYQPISTLELVVDRTNYPEVYAPEAEQQHEQPAPPRLPERKPVRREGSAPEHDATPAPAYSSPEDYRTIGYAGTLDMTTAVATVTPLHMLGEQPDTVDCPFCMRRVETEVKKKASMMTHLLGTALFFSTLCGAVAPYLCGWYVHVEHYCKNCRRKVARRRFDSSETEALGTRPEHRQVSRFEPAEVETKKKKPGS